jgi:putative FmdB family regulatory protein
MTYEYVCTACQHEWEAEQSISESPLKKCPSCKKSTAKRQISGGQGFILKGGGWYADGYGSSKGAAPVEGSSGSSSKSDGKSESKSDSKSEGKSEKATGSKPKGDGTTPKASKGSEKAA